MPFWRIGPGTFLTMKKSKKSLLLWLDRTLSQGLGSQLLLLFSLMLAAFVLANLLLLLSVSDWGRFCSARGINRWVAPLYLLIDGNAFTSVYENKTAGTTVLVACIIYLIGIFLFTGMTVSVMTNIIGRRVERYRDGLVHYLLSGHYLLLGYDDAIASFIGYILQRDPKADILLMTSSQPEKVREKLSDSFSGEQLRQIVINYGHRTSKEEYRKIRLESAKEVFVVGDHGDSAHDAVNIECLDAICGYLSQPGIASRPERLTCVFRDLDTYSSFKTTDIFAKFQTLKIDFIPYNYHVGCARQILTQGSYRSSQNGKTFFYPALFGNGKGITPEDEHFVHLVFVGTTNLAVSIAMEAAHVLHFPNFNTDQSRRTLITFIDKNADVEKDEFITRNRFFFEVQSYLYRDLTDGCGREQRKTEYLRGKDGIRTDFLDVQFQFIKGDIFARRTQELLSSWAEDTGHQYLSVFLTQTSHRQNFVMGMNMPDAVYAKGIPVFIRQDRSDNLVTNLREKSISDGSHPFCTWNGQTLGQEMRGMRYSRIYPVGMTEALYNDNELYLNRAKLINFLYETAARFNYEKFEGLLALSASDENEIWKSAEEAWGKLSVALKWSNLYSAYSIDTKLSVLRAVRSLAADDCSQDLWTLSDSEVEMLARTEHNRWNVEKLLMGFRKPLPSEDRYNHGALAVNKKHRVHHDIRPFEELGSVKVLDYEFSRYIPWILEMTREK